MMKAGRRASSLSKWFQDFVLSPDVEDIKDPEDISGNGPGHFNQAMKKKLTKGAVKKIRPGVI